MTVLNRPPMPVGEHTAEASFIADVTKIEPEPTAPESNATLGEDPYTRISDVALAGQAVSLLSEIAKMNGGRPENVYTRRVLHSLFEAILDPKQAPLPPGVDHSDYMTHEWRNLIAALVQRVKRKT